MSLEIAFDLESGTGGENGNLEALVLFAKVKICDFSGKGDLFGPRPVCYLPCSFCSVKFCSFVPISRLWCIFPIGCFANHIYFS